MDWIEKYLALTDGLPTPPLFRLWSAIGAIGAAMERRVWVETSRAVLYPNLFIMLVGPPGSGKSIAIEPARDLMIDSGKFHLSPDNMTKAALVDSLADADGSRIENGTLIEQHSLTIIMSEMGVFLPQHDLEFLSVLNHLYDNPRSHRERRRHSNAGKVKEIINPQLNIIAGTQPAFLASLLPEEAWGMGFMSRQIMIYANSCPVPDLFGSVDNRDSLKVDLIERLKEISGLHGRMNWAVDAAERLQKWLSNGQAPKPDHYKLQHYVSRRIIHILKLSMIASVAEGDQLIIKLSHVEKALDWIVQAESLMPDIFSDMTLKSDANVIHELHFWMFKEWQRTGKPIHESRLYQFLKSRVPGEKIQRIIEVAERSDVIVRQAGDKLYTPRARDAVTGQTVT